MPPKECTTCHKVIGSIYAYPCPYCKQNFCIDHKQAEKHDCIKARYAKFIRKTWIRKYEVNISTGWYSVACDQCGFTSESAYIEVAGEVREKHINEKDCDPSKVFLELIA